MEKRRCMDLRRLLFEEGISYAELGHMIDMSAGYISNRINGVTPWDAASIYLVAKALHIPKEEWVRYFLSDPPPPVRRASQ